MIAAGMAILWRRSARMGAAASAIIYSIFVACWVLRFYNAIHSAGWRMNIVFGFLFSVSQAVFLIVPALILYVLSANEDFVSEERTATAARWMLGLPPIFFGLAHLIGIRVFRNHCAAVVTVRNCVGGFDRHCLSPCRHCESA